MSAHVAPGVAVTVVVPYHRVLHAHIDHVYYSVSRLWFRWYTLPQEPMAGACDVTMENITWCHGHVTGEAATALLAASALAGATAD